MDYRKEKGDAAKIFNTAIDACQNIILDMFHMDEQQEQTQQMNIFDFGA